jgi:predicted DNA-binding protein
MPPSTYLGKNVRVDEETYKRIHTLSKEEGRSYKEILKRAILEYWGKSAGDQR